MRRILVIGTAAALLLGVLIATATATVEHTVEDVDGSPMTIPSSKVGDEVLYAWFFESKELEQAELSADTSSGSGSSAAESQANGQNVEAIKVEALDESVDRQHRLHDVVVIRTNSTFFGYTGTSVQYVELAKRSLVRTDYGSQFNGASQTLAMSSFYSPGRNAYFEHQGQTYRLGEEVLLRDQHFDCSGVGFGIGWGGSTGIAGTVGGQRQFGMSVQESACDPAWMPEIKSTRTWVAARGVVDDHDAYDIRTETVMTAADIDVTFDETGNVETHRGEEYELRVVSDQWVSSDLPYVLLQDTVGYKDGEESGRSQRVLQQYTPGNQEVPWGTGEIGPLPTLDRSEAGPNPSDGEGSKLPYPISQAITDVNGPLSPLAFQLWKQTHPAAMLVSARLQIGENSRSAQPSHMWNLFYAEPDGEAHEVATERIRGVAQPVLTDRGDKTIPAFEASIVPFNLVTFAEIEKAWTVLAPDTYTSRGPNYVQWGLEIDSTEGLTCLGSGSTSSAIDPAAAFRTVYVGWASEGSCAEVPPELDVSVLAYNAHAGELLMLVEFHDSFDLTPGPVSPRRPSIDTQSAAGTFEIVKPNVAVATVTSSSLLAIFLFAYFLPAIKVVGAQALLLIPGYAKLRKEAILDNRIRDQILETTKQDPGISITDLAKTVKAGWGTIVYHLGVLEKNKMVSMVLDGRHRRVFPVGLVDFSQQGQLAILKNERVRALYELIHDEPGVFQDQLAKRIGISAPATSWHLKRLEDSGLVGRVKEGRRVHYYANEKPQVHTPDGMEVA